MVKGRRDKGRSPLTIEQRERARQKTLRYYIDHPEHYTKICEINKNKAKRGPEHHFYGKTHTAETKAKISQRQLGKSYEEQYGKEKANKIKLKQSNKMKGVHKKHIDIKLLLSKLIENPRYKMHNMATEFDISYPTMSLNLKLIFNVNNFQLFRHAHTDEELRIIYETLLLKYTDE